MPPDAIWACCLYNVILLNGTFTLPDSDSDFDSDSDSKPYGYIVLCRNFSHWFGSGFGSLSHSICKVQESESAYGSESGSGNVNKPEEVITSARTEAKSTAIKITCTTLQEEEDLNNGTHASVNLVWHTCLVSILRQLLKEEI